MGPGMRLLRLLLLPALLILLILVDPGAAAAATDPIEIALIESSPDDYHLRQVTLHGRVHEVRLLDPYYQSSGTVCTGAYLFTLEDDSGYLPVAVLGVCGRPFAGPPEVSEGDRIVLQAVIHAPGRFGSFYDLTGRRTPGGGTAPLHAVARAIEKASE